MVIADIDCRISFLDPFEFAFSHHWECRLAYAHLRPGHLGTRDSATNRNDQTAGVRGSRVYHVTVHG